MNTGGGQNGPSFDTFGTHGGLGRPVIGEPTNFRELEDKMNNQRSHMLYTDKLHKDHIFDAYQLNRVQRAV